MSNSFQNEIPDARINITLDVETEGAKEKKELPLKILVLGDFSQGKDKRTLVDRERISIDKNNFDDVLKELNPGLYIHVNNKIEENGKDVSVRIGLDSMHSFSPDGLVKAIPELRTLLAMRNLLKDFKSNVLENPMLRKELSRVVNQKNQLEELNKYLEKWVSRGEV